jgi:hypothetical protein
MVDRSNPRWLITYLANMNISALLEEAREDDFEKQSWEAADRLYDLFVFDFADGEEDSPALELAFKEYGTSAEELLKLSFGTCSRELQRLVELARMGDREAWLTAKIMVERSSPVSVPLSWDLSSNIKGDLEFFMIEARCLGDDAQISETFFLDVEADFKPLSAKILRSEDVGGAQALLLVTKHDHWLREEFRARFKKLEALAQKQTVTA